MQNTRRMQEIQKNLHDRYGIRYTENSNIQILQKLLEQAKQNMHNLEEQQRQNERDLKELQHYQKEIDTYLGKKHEDI